MRHIMSGRATQSQIGGFLTAMRMKGVSVEEVTAFARGMREFAHKIKPDVGRPLVDMCGTGGDAIKTFNVSTANAILTAAAGVPVAKHGSRSISSPSGSADVLEALGVNIDQTPEKAARMIEEIGISFIYAPNFHPVMLKVFGPENQLGIKTIFFTIIGPLINPAGARNHTIGVYKPELVHMMADVVAEMDFNHVIVAHGLDGLDEISLIGQDIHRGDQGEEGQILRSLSRGFRVEALHPRRDRRRFSGVQCGGHHRISSSAREGTPAGFLTLNNAATLYVSGKAKSIQDGLAIPVRFSIRAQRSASSRNWWRDQTHKS